MWAEIILKNVFYSMHCIPDVVTMVAAQEVQRRAEGLVPPSEGSKHREHWHEKCFVCLNTACLEYIGYRASFIL